MINKDDNNAKQRKTIFSVIYVFSGLFVLVMGYFSYFLLFKSNEIINSTYNRREEILSERVIRGKILASDYSVLAETVVNQEGKEVRQYPYGDMYTHVLGRTSRGLSGIEEAENIRLLTSNTEPIENMYNDLIGQKNIGDNVVTTLDANLQKIAYDALGDNRGAVVVLEPSTGKILAMVSKPTYDPNQVDEIWDEMVANKEEESPLLNRATQGLYPPGSTFKLLTALTFLRENPDYEDYDYNCKGSMEYDDMTIHCYNGKVHGEVDLKKSFAKSCNTSFANIGKDLNMEEFRSICEDFLYNKPLPVNMASSVSSFELKVGSSGVKEEMQTAIGQGKTLVTPLHNAMIASAVANGGLMMKPYVVDHIENAGGAVIKSYHPQSYNRPMTSEEAEYLSGLMRAVVTSGTADELKDLKVKAAGKTGSADQEGKPAHAWFIGFAPLNDPQIAVSIIVESKGTGSEYAVPIARKIFNAYFK
jgi:peptidoglycan glycosyltransferase